MQSAESAAGSAVCPPPVEMLEFRRVPDKVVRSGLLRVRTTLGPDWEILTKGCFTFNRSSRHALLASELKSASNFQGPLTDWGGIRRSPARRMASNPTK